MRLTRHLPAVAVSGLLLGGGAVAASTQRETSGGGKGSRCSTAIEDRNLRLFQQRLDGLTSGDPSALQRDRDYFADDATVVVNGSVPYAGTYSVTNGEYGQVLQATWAITPGVAGSSPQLYADCDKVILVGSFQATAKTTGKPLDTSVIEIFTYRRDGKILRDDFSFTDTVAVNRALAP